MRFHIVQPVLFNSRSSRRKPRHGFTLLEVTLATLVLVFGLFGAAASILIGLRHSRRSISNTGAAIIGRSVLDYLQVDPEVDRQWPTNELLADNSGTVVRRVSDNQLQLSTGAWTSESRTGWILLVASSSTAKAGNTQTLKGKLYEITDHNAGSDTVTCDDATFVTSDQENGDYVTPGTPFLIVGNITNTLPAGFFSSNPQVRTHIHTYALDADLNFAVTATPPRSALTFSYMCVLSGTVPGMDNLAQVDIFVFRNFNTNFRPEHYENGPPIAHFVSYVMRR